MRSKPRSELATAVRPPDSEKITINLGYVDLGQIDLLVAEVDIAEVDRDLLGVGWADGRGQLGSGFGSHIDILSPSMWMLIGCF